MNNVAAQMMVKRGIYVPRNDSGKLTISKAQDRYRKDVSPTKQASTQDREKAESSN